MSEVKCRDALYGFLALSKWKEEADYTLRYTDLLSFLVNICGCGVEE
jgi:hypothetical protein